MVGVAQGWAREDKKLVEMLDVLGRVLVWVGGGRRLTRRFKASVNPEYV